MTIPNPHNVIGLFPIPVACYRFPGDITPLKDQVRSYIKELTFNQNNDNPNLKHYMQKGDNADGKVTLKDSFFKHFEDQKLWNFFTQSAFNFHTEVLGLMIQSEYTVVDAWVNHCSSGDQPFHAHINSFISGTFYLDHDDNAAPIEFVNPKLSHQTEPAISFTPDHNLTTVFSAPTAQIKPIPGDLLLWQSHIRHGYSNNQSPNRLSLSMNMIPRVVFSHRYGFECTPLEEEWSN
jgi:uncharacterized protein (TIGR02466 family)